MRAKPVQVNKLVFPSAREAARYIVAEEAKLGNSRKENTITKELKRVWQGASWSMYAKWFVIAPADSAAGEGKVEHD